LRHAVDLAGTAVLRRRGFNRLPPHIAVHLAYEVLLDRPPDPAGLATWLPAVRSGAMPVRDLVAFIEGSSEFETRSNFSAQAMLSSIHAGRSRFVKSLPRAQRIVDLGGTNLGDRRGALLSLGYPYRFESLVIVDLPPDDRHPIYWSEAQHEVVETGQGPVSYRYHSMVDLSDLEDASVDLVYSGQSIEHVTVEEGAIVLKQVARILRPGGHLALDTPNGRITRMQQEELIDPDHKVEYTWPELAALIGDAGFEIEWAKGLNYAGESASRGDFDMSEAAAHCGLFDAIEDCYILAVVATKPVAD
jgi:SAM-dependent methyltransferase